MLGFASQCQQTHCWAADRSLDRYVKENCVFIYVPWSRTTDSTNCSKTHSRWFGSAPSRTGCPRSLFEWIVDPDTQSPGWNRWAETQGQQCWQQCTSFGASAGRNSYEAGKTNTRTHNAVSVTKIHTDQVHPTMVSCKIQWKRFLVYPEYFYMSRNSLSQSSAIKFVSFFHPRATNMSLFEFKKGFSVIFRKNLDTIH